MNREIKFRGKRIDSGEWFYGDLIHGVGYKEGNTYILPLNKNLAYIPSCDPLDGVKVIPETIGQFTGFYDKNGKEIYEGDILKSNYKDIYWVKYENGGFYIYDDLGRYSSIERSFEVFEEKEMQVEVIGNIHDNPELLEE